MIHDDKFFILGISSNGRFGRAKEVIALKYSVNDKSFFMKLFLSVLCLSYGYGNVLTGTTSTAIISVQLQLPENYSSECSKQQDKAVVKRSVIGVLVFAEKRNFLVPLKLRE